MYRMITIEKLIPHPENSNRMPVRLMAKLESNIRKSGNYETITVRRHPERDGDFQILNGHHRVEILRKVGIGEIKCDVWEVNDKEARLLVATLNRLEGNDVPELRFGLIRSLLVDYDPSELECLIPENNKQLEEFVELCKEDFNETRKWIVQKTSHLECDIPDLRVMDFILNAEKYDLVNKALNTVIQKKGCSDKNEALCELARSYQTYGQENLEYIGLRLP
jgi:hypothetical protein